MAYSIDQIMLTLAAITYRGYYLTLPEPAKRARMYQAMTDCLRKLGPVKDQWDIVWGPVSFNSVHAGFDDAAMFVARQRGKPATFATPSAGPTRCLCSIGFSAISWSPNRYHGPTAPRRQTSESLSVLRSVSAFFSTCERNRRRTMLYRNPREANHRGSAVLPALCMNLLPAKLRRNCAV